MWFLFSLLWTLLLAKMRIIDHTSSTPTQPPHASAFKMASIEATTDSTWSILITGKGVAMNDTASDIFLGDIKESLSHDGCSLLLSKTSSRIISLRIACSLTVTVPPSLKTTKTLLASRFIEDVSIAIDRFITIRNPSQWRSSEAISPQEEADVYQDEMTNYVQYPAEWHLARIDSRAQTNDRTYSYPNDASNVDIYIPDSGIRASHTDFDGRAFFLHNTIRDGITTDCNGHGTHVAGIAASRTYGVAKKATVFGIRVLDCKGEGVLDDIVEAVDVIIEKSIERLPRRGVINLSLGGEKNAILDAMIDLLRLNNLVVVVAAGNEARDACTLSPSNKGSGNYVLSVGASDRLDTRPSWSNYGACVSISAPGVGITSTWHTSNTALAILSGTSMSSPVVAGVAAMILQEDPTLSVADVNELIIQRATPRVVRSTSNLGGGSSLVFSLDDPFGQIDDTQPLTVNDATGSLPEGSLLLCVTLTILYALCVA